MLQFFNITSFLAVIHSWNLFLLIMSIPTLIAGMAFHFLPESPKFLMSRGQNKKALAVFQEIYRRNQKPGDSSLYPISTLADEKYVAATSAHKSVGKIDAQLEDGSSDRQGGGGGKSTSTSAWIGFKRGLVQMSTIFEGAYLGNCLLMFTIQFGFLWSQNTLRLWLPSILAMVTEFEEKKSSSAAFDLCTIIESSTATVTTSTSSWNSTETISCSQVRF